MEIKKNIKKNMNVVHRLKFHLGTDFVYFIFNLIIFILDKIYMSEIETLQE